jgi:hypothetical protein
MKIPYGRFGSGARLVAVMLLFAVATVAMPTMNTHAAEAGKTEVTRACASPAAGVAAVEQVAADTAQAADVGDVVARASESSGVAGRFGGKMRAVGVQTTDGRMSACRRSYAVSPAYRQQVSRNSLARGRTSPQESARVEPAGARADPPPNG